MSHLEDLVIEQSDIESSIYHTIVIAKGLTHIDPKMVNCIHFWKHF